MEGGGQGLVAEERRLVLGQVVEEGRRRLGEEGLGLLCKPVPLPFMGKGCGKRSIREVLGFPVHGQYAACARLIGFSITILAWISPRLLDYHCSCEQRDRTKETRQAMIDGVRRGHVDAECMAKMMLLINEAGWLLR